MFGWLVVVIAGGLGALLTALALSWPLMRLGQQHRRDARRIAQALAGELLQEERALAETRRKLHLLEAEMLKRLVELGRE